MPTLDQYKSFISFVSASSHDLNNTLAALRGFAEFLDEDLPEGSAEKKFASKIVLAAQQAQAEIEKLQAEVRAIKE